MGRDGSIYITGQRKRVRTAEKFSGAAEEEREKQQDAALSQDETAPPEREAEAVRKAQSEMEREEEKAAGVRAEPGDTKRAGECEKRSERTRYRLARAMKERMKTAPVDRISVCELARDCGITRQTFYRNFQDKYDLINWYFDRMLEESFVHMGEGRTVYEGLVKKFAFIRKESVFFTGAFRYDEQNCLREHDFERILRFYTELIREKTGRGPDGKTRFFLEMYCQGSVYMTVRWALGGMRETDEEMAANLAEAMPKHLEELFVKLGLLREHRGSGQTGSRAAGS